MTTENPLLLLSTTSSGRLGKAVRQALQALAEQQPARPKLEGRKGYGSPDADERRPRR